MAQARTVIIAIIIEAAIRAAAPVEGKTAEIRKSSGSALRVAAASRRGGERLVHDVPDGAGTTAALRAAAKAMIDFAGGPRRNRAA